MAMGANRSLSHSAKCTAIGRSQGLAAARATLSDTTDCKNCDVLLLTDFQHTHSALIPMSPLGRLPAEWLSHCLSFLDLPALLAAGSVSVHWRASQQSRAAWACSSLEEGCSRAWSPVSFAQLAAPPPIFRRLLCAMRVDMELLAPLRDEDDEGEFDYDGQAQFDPARHAHAWPTLPPAAATVHPIPVAFVRSLFDSFAALRCLSVRDAQEVLAHDEISDLCRLAVERLRQISIERDEFKPAAMLGPLLQPPHDTRTQLTHIRLHTDAISTTVVPLPLSAMDALLALPSALESPSSAQTAALHSPRRPLLLHRPMQLAAYPLAHGAHHHHR